MTSERPRKKIGRTTFRVVAFVLLTLMISLMSSTVWYYSGLIEAHTPRIILSFIAGAVMASMMVGVFESVVFGPDTNLEGQQQ